MTFLTFCVHFARETWSPSDLDTAVEVGQNLIDRHFGSQVKKEETFKPDGTLYQLLEDSETNALNAGETSSCQPRPG